MASYQLTYYCRNCKTNVTVDEKGHCKKCGGTSLNKSWSVRFRFSEFNKEKQKRLTGFETKKEALQAYVNFTANNKPVVKLDENKLGFSDVFDEYIRNCYTDNEESTRYDKKHIFDKYIKPYFIKKQVNEITKADLVNWQSYICSLANEKTKKPFKHRYIIKIRVTFTHFLSYCETIHDIPNLFRYVRPPKNKDVKKQINFWELETFNKFINTVDDIMWQTLWYTFMYTGARFNEIRALRDDDINEDKITICHALAGHKSLSNKNSIKGTKNHKIVNKRIPDVLAVQIKKYKSWKQEQKMPGQFLFGGDLPLTENKIRRHLLDDIKQAKVPIITPHGFRHSYVSLLIHLNVPTKIIAELIGDCEEQVIKTYGHLYTNAKDLAINTLNQNLNKNLQMQVIDNSTNKKIVS